MFVIGAVIGNSGDGITPKTLPGFFAKGFFFFFIEISLSLFRISNCSVLKRILPPILACPEEERRGSGELSPHRDRAGKVTSDEAKHQRDRNDILGHSPIGHGFPDAIHLARNAQRYLVWEHGILQEAGRNAHGILQ